MGFEDASRFVGGNNVMRKDGTWRFGCRQYKEYRYDELKYHTSWDWLMPVVEKIESLGHETRIIGDEFCILKGHATLVQSDDGSSKIDSVYWGCLQFIQWYNENQQP